MLCSALLGGLQSWGSGPLATPTCAAPDPQHELPWQLRALSYGKCKIKLLFRVVSALVLCLSSGGNLQSTWTVTEAKMCILPNHVNVHACWS